MNELLPVWRGLDAWRAEAASVAPLGTRLVADGDQLGVEPRPYRLVYDLRSWDREITVVRGPLEDRDVMARISVPDLTVRRSAQRYTPLGPGRVNYASGNFSADIHFDEHGLVRLYENFLERVS